MRNNKYLKWVTENTKTTWCNDSAIMEDLEGALAANAVGCTSNPPLTYEALTLTRELFTEELKKLDKNLSGDGKAIALIEIVVKHISKRLMDLYEKSNGEYGYIRSQVKPWISGDFDAMLEMGIRFSKFGKNIKVKIPGTDAGIDVLEELAALGIPTNPTVCMSVSQIVAAAEANERGRKRAIGAGLAPAQSTSAVVMGRLQDYLSSLNEKRNLNISVYDLEWAVIAMAKRCYRIFTEQGYHQKLMPAAFRCTKQVEQLVGGDMMMTIHPKIQDKIIQEDLKGQMTRNINAIDFPVDEEAVERVKKAFPEFVLAYEPDAIRKKDFDSYKGMAMTLDAFQNTGWNKLVEYPLEK